MAYATLPGRLIIIGFGSIARGVIPLLLKHLLLQPHQVTIISAAIDGQEIIANYNIPFKHFTLTKDNYVGFLDPLISKDDFVLNLSVNVSSLDLIRLCKQKGALYLDSCIEPWKGGYTDPSLPLSLRTNYALREQALELKKEFGLSPTAIVAYGANPGLISQITKQALIKLAQDTGISFSKPTKREEWALLAQSLQIKVIHIAERDTQVSLKAKSIGEFVNSWSVDGFIGEGMQPAELGWGTHEKTLPPDGFHHKFGKQSAIYLTRPGASVKVRSWTPTEGPYHGFLITHNEAISISDYFTLQDGNQILYRPTVHYAYHPCDDAVLSIHELAGKNWIPQQKRRILMEEIIDGHDELGVLLMGHKKGAFWYGSKLSNKEAKTLVPYNNATSLQVAISVLAGMIWALQNPLKGIIEADEIDFEHQMQICLPYLGEMIGCYTDWNPLFGRNYLFPEKLDFNDPWQFGNFRVD